MAGKRMSSLDGPIHIVCNVGEERRAVAGFKVFENIADLRKSGGILISPAVEASASSSPLLHECRDQHRYFACCGVEREMPAVHDVDFGLRNVAAIRFRLRRIE